MSGNNSISFICPYIHGYIKPGEDESIGGAERQQYLLAKELFKRGYDISFITFRREGYSNKENIDGFDIYYTIPKSNDIKDLPYIIFNLLMSIRSCDPDVVYVRGNPPLSMITRLCCDILSIKSIYCVANDSNIQITKLSRHHDLFDKYIIRKMYFRSLKNYTKVVSQTDKQTRILHNTHNINSHQIPNMYDIPSENNISTVGEREYFLWVGSLTEQKQPEKYIRLARTNPHINFYMIGSSTDENVVEKYKTYSKNISNLNYLGFVPPDTIDQYYKDAIGLINTSDHEGFPNTFLEAWRLGIPVISLHYDFSGDLSIDKGGVFSGTFENLSDDINYIYKNREKSYEIGVNGREYIKSNYGVESVMDKYIKLLGSI